MADPFIGEIRAVAFKFAPQGWADCNGATIPIQQNQALFSLIGTIYGGDGMTTFKIPDLQSRVIVGVGQGAGLSAYPQGQAGGREAATVSAVLAANNMPAHTHSANISGLTSTGTVTINCNNTAASATNGTQASFGKANTTVGKTTYDVNTFNTATPDMAMSSDTASFSGTVGGSITISQTGQAQPAAISATGDCRQPYLAVRYIISMEGIYPTQN